MLDRSIKMLVADDAETIRAIFREVAHRSCGLIDVIEASNGRDCVKLLSRSDIDLAFIDVYMPEMSGLEALRGARHVGVKTFVTLMSGHDDDKLREFARQLRAYEFLHKPFHVRDVEAIIRTYQRAAKSAKVLVVDELEDGAPTRSESPRRKHLPHGLLRSAGWRERARVLRLGQLRHRVPRLQHARPRRACDARPAVVAQSRRQGGDDLERARQGARVCAPCGTALRRSCTSRSSRPISMRRCTSCSSCARPV